MQKSLIGKLLVPLVALAGCIGIATATPTVADREPAGQVRVGANWYAGRLAESRGMYQQSAANIGASIGMYQPPSIEMKRGPNLAIGADCFFGEPSDILNYASIDLLRVPEYDTGGKYLSAFNIGHRWVGETEPRLGIGGMRVYGKTKAGYQVGLERNLGNGWGTYLGYLAPFSRDERTKGWLELQLTRELTK